MDSQGTEVDHFSQVGKMVALGSGSHRKVFDFELSRCTCYLPVWNGEGRRGL